MEQKKILLVAISVGVFLIIVIGAAILVFGSGNTTPAIASPRPIAPGTPGINLPAQSPYSEPPDTPTPRTQQIDTPPPAPETSAQAASQIHERVGNSEPTTVVSVSRPSTAAVPDTPPAPGTAPARSTTPAPARSASPQTTTPQAAPQAPAQAAPQAQTQSAPQAAARPAPVQVTPSPQPPARTSRVQNNYWVQTGAFTAMSRAQGVRESLAARGINSIIDNRVVNGTTFFRVRVGPYTSRNEADYWLSLIKSINGFEDSQIFQTQTAIN